MTGRKTASGEPHDPRRLTAAHRTLSLGTRVRVTRLDREGRPTASSVEVRINNRGPYANGRIIDLSRAAAERLDMVHAGVIRVRIEVINPPP